MSRLPPKTIDEYPTDQQEVVEHWQQLLEKAFGPSGQVCVYKDSRGALLGPFPFILHNPIVAQAHLTVVGAMAKMGLPPDARETTVLTVGAKFQAAFQLYSHGAAATKAGLLSTEQTETLRKGNKPVDLNERCSIAYDAAHQMLNVPGPLPQSHWDKLVACFGYEGTLAWIQHVGFYSYVSMILNSINVPLPE